MTISFRFGDRNNKALKQASIFLRVRHNNYYFIKSLNIKVKNEHWNFSECFIVDTNKKEFWGIANELNEIKDKLILIERTFKRNFDDLQFKTKGFVDITKEQWKEWCAATLLEITAPLKPKELAPYLSDLMQEFIEFNEKLGTPKSRSDYGHSPATSTRWKNLRNNFISFENAIGKKFRTTQLDHKNFYLPFKKWVDSEHSTISYNTFVHIIKKIHATCNYYKSEGIEIHPKVFSKEFAKTETKKEIITFTAEEMEMLFSYSATAGKNNAVKVFRLQYDLCLRYSDLELNFKDKSKEDIKRLIYEDVDAEGRPIYKIRLKQQKAKGEAPKKNVPISNNTKELLETVPFEITRLNTYNNHLSDIQKQLNINKDNTSHSLRKSKCTNLKIMGISDEEICMYSGHTDPKILRENYIDWARIDIKTNVKLN